MKTNHKEYQSLETRQEKRIRFQHGLTETQARIIAPFVFGEVRK